MIAAELGTEGWVAASADDHDDDDDDDDDGGASVGAGGGGERGAIRSRRVTNAVRPSAAQAAAEQPEFALEIVVSDLSDGDLATLIAEGFVQTERRRLTALAVTLDRLAAPPGLTLAAARDRVRQLASGSDADFNHYYRTSGDSVPVAGSGDDACRHENCAAWQMIDWLRSGAEHCRAGLRIGLIDTGINPDHEILGRARLTILQRPSATAPSGAIHGTAVASLLVGDVTSRVPGLLPWAELFAVDVFSAAKGDERADAAALVEGLDLLAARQVRLYNLSLAGPPNTVLSRMIDRMTDAAGLDAVIVAAMGNDGAAAGPASPGAHPDVIAVTAVDARGRVYRQAQRGDHLGLAAPGVNLLAATSVRGARAKSGTSYAVPFVTAAAALILAREGSATGRDVRARLFASARDLGAAGPDPVFGHGLLSASGLCLPATE